MITTTTRLVQISHPQYGRRVALVEEPALIILHHTHSIYELALEAIHTKKKIKELIKSRLSDETMDYSSVYSGKAAWMLLPSFDHPETLFGCLVSGTGLTHKNSAMNRQLMHQSEESKLTDSMQMYQWGLAGGQPKAETIGVQPEWFYKGNGAALRAHGQSLEVPNFANDGGEEPEVAGAYVVDQQGQPWRVGFTTANEFSDHIMEQKNYLYLAPSKLRNCAIGPELVIDLDFQEIKGRVNIIRNNEAIWSKDICTGEKSMAHSLANLEHHHFKYSNHRIPFQAHVHFLGADAFSFGEKILLQRDDVMEVYWEGMGRSLQNTLTIAQEMETLMKIKSLGEN